MPKSLLSALRISSLYCIFAGLWIVFSDKLLQSLIHDVTILTYAQILKGWLFVAVTTGLLFLLVSRSFLRIESLNRMDSLTGLMRYNAFKKDLETKTQQRQNDQVVLLMYLDFSKFSYLNKSLGFEAADKILISFAKRLKGLYSADASLARLGPDQFAVGLLLGQSRDEIDDAINQFRHVFDANARAKRLDLNCVMGVAIMPSDGSNATALMSAATSALNKAKAEGSAVQFFNKELSQQESQRQQLLQDLRNALERDALTVVYQPQFDLTTGAITGVEVLIRWEHPQHGFIAPDVFVNLAEENNLCCKLSALVIRKAYQELTQYGLLGSVIPRVSINISAVEFNSPALMDRLIEQIEQEPELAKYLQIEITETAALEDIQRSAQIIEQLKNQHIRFSVDDFGTGYTSLVILRDLPVNEVKIDRSFINGITQDKKSRAIVESIITMTKGFDMTVVAEGVETQDQQTLLHKMGCNEAQGYMLAMPMDIKTLSYHIENRIPA